MSGGSNRNTPCPCGSGKKFKDCHGSVESRTNSRTTLFISVGALLLAALSVSVWLGSRDGSNEAAKPQVRATQYGEIPGLDLERLPADVRYTFVSHLNHTPCICDCEMTIAECRHKDPGCEHSERVVREQFVQLLDQQIRVPPAAHE